MSAINSVPDGFKQSDVGIIPKTWDVKPFGECFNIISGLGFAKSEYTQSGLNLLRIDNVSYGKVLWDSIAYLPENYVNKYPHLILEAGDLLLALNRPITNGKLKLAKLTPHDLPSILYQRVGKISTSDKNIDLNFAFYLLTKFIKLFVEESAVGTDQPFISTTKLKKYDLPIPPKKEQTAIANALSDVDALLTELEKLIAKKQAIKTATMQQLLTGKTRLTQFATFTEGEKQGQAKDTKPSELGEIPEDWDVLLMDEVTDSLSSGATPFRGNPSFFKGNNRWITSGELKYGVINDTIEKVSDEAIKKANLKVHPSGTFLMAITGLEAAGTRGSCGIVGAPATTNQSCMAIYPNKKLKSNYLFHWYVYNGEELALKYCQGTKQLSYTAGLLKTIPVLVPRDTSEQTAIATILSDMDNEIQTLDQRLAKTRQIKQGMMQELLTGRTRLI
ncbi:restriction endonuclease subunit S [Pseudoalteromonas sp.]|uniref:restriction endonuclease subunit S n=1 Tax=Pseudoalteromonas sp. TaxID=53249 RepID=UPI0035C725BC